MRVLGKFIDANRNLSRAIEPYLPQAKLKPQDFRGVYEVEVARHMNSRPNQVVADVGGGKACHFAKYRDPAMKARLVAVDVSEEELNENRDADEKRVADITQGLPFGPEEVDMVVSSWVLEHLQDLEAFIVDSERVLREGGYFVHLFPSKFAPFALINRALPRTASSRLLSFLCRPGFPAFYDNCYYSAIKALLEKHGFEVMEVRLHYYQSRYFTFFFPLYVLSALYELLLYSLKAKNLCAFLLVVARKSSPDRRAGESAAWDHLGMRNESIPT